MGWTPPLPFPPRNSLPSYDLEPASFLLHTPCFFEYFIDVPTRESLRGGAVYIKCPGKIRSNNYSKSFHLFTDSEKLRFHLFKQKYTKLRQRNKKEKVSRC